MTKLTKKEAFNISLVIAIVAIVEFTLGWIAGKSKSDSEYEIEKNKEE